MRFLKPFIIVFVITAAFTACKKNSASYDTTPNFYIVNGGTTSFDNSLILFPAADTVTYNLIISSTFLLPKDVTVTLAVADDLRQSYNTSYNTNYQAMPSNAYTFQTTFTAGTTNTYDTVPVTLNKKFLSSGNFMLPIKIATVSDYKIDSTTYVIYVHTEDNNLSGIYSSAITKNLYTGDTVTGSLSSTDTSTITKNLTPISETTSELNYADLGANGWKYELSFGVDGNTFTAKPNDVILNSVQADSFTILSTSFDPLTKKIYIKSSYKNSSGDARIVEESLSLQ